MTAIKTLQAERKPKAINLTGKRLLICEEGLIDYNAHFYGWVKAIRKINQTAGAEVHIAGNQTIIPAIRDELGVHPVFSRNNWSDIYNSRGRAGRAMGVLEHNWFVYREVSQLLEQIGHVDCILLPAVRAYHLLAWNRMCKKYLGKGFNRLVMFLLNSHAIYNEDHSDYEFKRSSNWMRRLLKSFSTRVEDGSVVLCGDSHITCGEYERLSGLPFRVFPSPGVALNQMASTDSDDHQTADGPVFIMLGVSFFDKGIDLLQQAIIRHFNDNSDSNARFVVQWSKETIDYDGTRIEIDSKLRELPQVTLIERTLSDEEYRDVFRKADFLVLPYRRSVYFNRLSGVAVEAACSGIPMIVTENTWLDWAVQKFGAGVSVKNEDVTDLMNKIAFCCDHWLELKAEARSRQSVALRYNSAENYLKCQWT